MTVRVKICGVTTPDDAAAAVDAGAALVGLNFVSGTPRVLDLAEAEAVSRRVAGQVERVAVFRDTPRAEANRILDRIEVDWVQLHGSETPEDAAALSRPTIKALKGADAAVATAFPDSLLLLDHPATAAGSGVAWDWSAATPLIEAGREVVLAGGLDPGNVAAALRGLRGFLPWGVDVASGVEASPRRKDAARMRAFVQAVRDVEAAS